jgi:maltose O-acetyltransferase
MARVLMSDTWRRVLVRAVAPSPWLSERHRAGVLRAAGIDIGPGTRIRPGSEFVNDHLTIGARCFINASCVFDPGSATVTIGDDVNIGVGVVLVGVDHAVGPARRRAGDDTSAPVTVGDGCWIGARVVVLPGVTIAPGCLIGAGSIVTSDTDANGVYWGAPARWQRWLDP